MATKEIRKKEGVEMTTTPREERKELPEIKEAHMKKVTGVVIVK
ncbi:MAG: hypothetical protein PHI66_01440 [Candidatus Pacebacteria bacterium]|nr:hypothetical protein [Candidatus Paceibacterota bacterium]